jgi:DNA-binding transcriptional ArsR family regulator
MIAMVTTSDSENIVFAAISHPVRRQILDLLISSDQSVSAISGHFEMSRPAVSQHLRILLDSGLVTEQRFGRERRYHLEPAALKPVREWLRVYERFWDYHLLKLQKHMAKSKKK